MPKKFLLLIRSLFCGLVVITFANPASAAMMVFDNEAAFDLANPVLPLTIESFEGFDPLVPAPIMATDFTLSTSNSSGAINLAFTGVHATDGVNYFGWSYPSDTSMTFSFNSPQSVFSMDITDLASIGDTSIEVFFGVATDPLAEVIYTGFFDDHGNQDFLGFISTEVSFDSLKFNFTVGEWIGIDRVRYGAIPAVPVPAAFWLFGTALIGFIGFSRRTQVG
jgi:hypothetical protein